MPAVAGLVRWLPLVKQGFAAGGILGGWLSDNLVDERQGCGGNSQKMSVRYVLGTGQG